MKEYLNDVESVLDSVSSSQSGLTGAEAEKRLASNGKNKLREEKKDSLLKRFFLQLIEPMTIVLLAAAAISGVLAVRGRELCRRYNYSRRGNCKRRFGRISGKQSGKSH